MLLDNNQLDDTCVELIAELVGLNHKAALRQLSVSSNSLGPRFAAYTLQLLRAQKDLEALEMDNNRGVAAVGGYGADLARVLKEVWARKGGAKLWRLSVSLDDFKQTVVGGGKAGAARRGVPAAGRGGRPGVAKGAGKDPMNAFAFVKLALCGKERPPLLALELKHSRLSAKTVALLAKSPALRTLTHLDLTNAMIGAGGVQALMAALGGGGSKEKGEVALLHLGLRGNFAADYGAKCVATALKSPAQALTSVDLTSNYVRDEGAAALVDALEGNATLASLRLGHNRFGNGVVARLLKLARKPSSPLVRVDLEGHTGG
jgi:Ran GTPase-activating protein (RanGAP) involved in mRNA processing and transport